MKKTIFIMVMISLIFSNIWAEKVSEKLALGEIKLILENVHIDKLDFSQKSKVEVESKSKVMLELVGDKLYISSEEPTEIDLVLPAQNSYLYQNAEQENLHFSADFIDLIGSEGEKIRINSEGVFVDDNDSKVQVSGEGIFVEDGDEVVSITSEGIIVSGTDNDVTLTGFWGSILGSIIKGVSSTAISYAGKHPEKFIKDMLNEEDSDFSFDFDDCDNDYISETVEQIVDYRPGMKLKLFNQNGSVEVETWNKEQIEIVAKKRISQSRRDYQKKLADTEIMITAEKDCEIETKIPLRAEVSVSYQIKLPHNMEIEKLQSSNGSLQVSGTKNGEYISSNGSIWVEDISGDFLLNTTNGKIDAKNIPGIFSAKTTNAAITIKNCNSLRALQTSNGSIRAELNNLKHDLLIGTSNATIDLELGEIDAELTATTSNSRITTEGLNLQNMKNSNNYLSGRLGRGGNELQISTTNGRISIKGNKGEWE